MKKAFSILLALTVMTASCSVSFAETAPGSMGGNPPAQGETPPDKPDGQPGGAPGSMGGGMSSAPSTYDAVTTSNEDASYTGDMTSTGTDENVLHVTGGTATVTDATITRTSSDSTGGDSSSFYGVGAALLTTGGTLTVADSTITTDAKGGAGVFAYGDGVAYVSDTTITTEQDTSGGIHVAGGGTLYARNLTVSTAGESSAAIRSDRGSGTMVVDGGSYTSTGVGSPAVYVTADISIHNAALTATGSEALCMEGMNTVRLYDCDLSGAMQDLSQNDNTWTVIVYQSMSGDAAVGEGLFEMSGGSLTSANGGLFYTTNTDSEFILENVAITASEDSEYFLRVTGNSNSRGWGQTGANGANCRFTGIQQTMVGDVQWDSISSLTMYLTQGSTLTGAVVQDESCAGNGGDGTCTLVISADSTWIVTGDSTVTTLNCAGEIRDADGNAVTIADENGNILVSGTSAYTITVSDYSADADVSGAGEIADWENYAVAF